MKAHCILRMVTMCFIMILSFGIKGFAVCFSLTATPTPPGPFPTFPASGGSSFFILNQGGVGCRWVVSNQSSFIINVSPFTGSGPGQVTVNFTVAPNPDLAPRTGTLQLLQSVNNSSIAYTIPQAAASGDFAIAASPASQTVAPVNGTSYNIAISRSGQFTGCVNLSVPPQPSGVSVSFSPSVVCGSSATLNVALSGSACAASLPLIISGNNGNQTRTTSVTLSIVGDFSLSAGPRAVVQGGSSSATVFINQSQGFSAPITLSASGQLSGVSVNFAPNPTQGSSSTMTITTTTGVPLGSFPLTINGVSGCLTRTAPDTVSVAPGWWPAIQELLK